MARLQPGEYQSLRDKSVSGLSNIFQVRIEKTGDWVSLASRLAMLPSRMDNAVKQAFMEFAELYKASALTLIDTGAIGPALKPHYLAQKTREGHPEQVYKYTSTLRNSIVITTVSKRGVSIGIPKGLRRPETSGAGGGIEVAEYAKIMENGSWLRNIPPRPLFKPAFRAAGGRDKLISILNQRLKLGILAS